MKADEIYGTKNPTPHRVLLDTRFELPFGEISVANHFYFFNYLLLAYLLILRIFTMIYNVLQHYNDKRCSPESWSS